MKMVFQAIIIFHIYSLILSYSAPNYKNVNNGMIISQTTPCQACLQVPSANTITYTTCSLNDNTQRFRFKEVGLSLYKLLPYNDKSNNLLNYCNFSGKMFYFIPMDNYGLVQINIWGTNLCLFYVPSASFPSGCNSVFTTCDSGSSNQTFKVQAYVMDPRVSGIPIIGSYTFSYGVSFLPLSQITIYLQNTTTGESFSGSYSVPPNYTGIVTPGNYNAYVTFPSNTGLSSSPISFTITVCRVDLYVSLIPAITVIYTDPGRPAIPNCGCGGCCTWGYFCTTNPFILVCPSSYGLMNLGGNGVTGFGSSCQQYSLCQSWVSCLQDDNYEFSTISPSYSPSTLSFSITCGTSGAGLQPDFDVSYIGP